MSRNVNSSLSVQRVVGLAALAGARSMAGPALLIRHLNRHPSRRLKRRWKVLQKSRTANILTLLAIGEMIGDKLPTAPNRTTRAALTGRGIAGVVIGSALFKRSRRSPGWGAAVGAASALAGAYATFYLRKQLSDATSVPDPVWGGVEDLLVIKAGQRLLKQQ